MTFYQYIPMSSLYTFSSGIDEEPFIFMNIETILKDYYGMTPYQKIKMPNNKSKVKYTNLKMFESMHPYNIVYYINKELLQIHLDDEYTYRIKGEPRYFLYLDCGTILSRKGPLNILIKPVTEKNPRTGKYSFKVRLVYDIFSSWEDDDGELIESDEPEVRPSQVVKKYDSLTEFLNDFKDHKILPEQLISKVKK